MNIHETTFNLQGYSPIKVRLINPISGASFNAEFMVNQELSPTRAQEIARSFAVGQNWNIDELPRNVALRNPGERSQYSEFVAVFFAAMGLGNLGPNHYRPSQLDSSQGVELPDLD